MGISTQADTSEKEESSKPEPAESDGWVSALCCNDSLWYGISLGREHIPDLVEGFKVLKGSFYRDGEMVAC